MYTPQNWNGLIRGNLFGGAPRRGQMISQPRRTRFGKTNGANYNKNSNKFVKLVSVYGLECGGDITE